jgi:hypothetical protein
LNSRVAKWLRFSGPALLAVFICGCSVPLGPGFRLRSRALTFQESPGALAPVHLRVTEQMENKGNRPLAFLDVALPGPGNTSRSNLAIRVAGRPVLPVAISNDPSAPVRLPFDPPWPVRQRREVVFEYDLVTNSVSGSVAGVTPGGFYLADPRALPFWITPVGVFASGDVLARDERFEITLPADYRIVASGHQQRRRAADGKFLYRFRTSGKEPPTFVIGGRYLEQVIHLPTGDVIFWTFRPLDPDVAQRAAGPLSATYAILSSYFGTNTKPAAPLIIEAPAGLFASRGGEPALAASFPGGLLLSSNGFDRGIASESVLRAAESEMTRIWFGWRVPLRPEIDTILGRGLGQFAVVLAAEQSGGRAARQAEIVRMLAEYDQAPPELREVSMLRPPEQCTPAQLSANALRAALFLEALDDMAGRDKFMKALRTMQTAMAGRALMLSLDDLRSALEAATETPMADVFRQWINGPRVPDEFRRRYGASALAVPTPSARPPTLGLASPEHDRGVVVQSRRHS